MLRRNHPRTAALAQGFTLIEVMIVVTVIGILSSIAYPSYARYVLRAQITEATSKLQGLQADMERHFQNYRTYASVTINNKEIKNPCSNQQDVGEFKISCASSSPTEYKLQAAGKGFKFTLNQLDEVTSQEDDEKEQVGCWIMGKGEKC